MELKPGWLNRQLEKASRNSDEWPEWLRRAAGFGKSRPPVERRCHNNPITVTPNNGCLVCAPGSVERRGRRKIEG